MTDNEGSLLQVCGDLRQFLPLIVEMAPSDVGTQDGHYPTTITF